MRDKPEFRDPKGQLTHSNSEADAIDTPTDLALPINIVSVIVHQCMNLEIENTLHELSRIFPRTANRRKERRKPSIYKTLTAQYY